MTEDAIEKLDVKVKQLRREAAGTSDYGVLAELHKRGAIVLADSFEMTARGGICEDTEVRVWKIREDLISIRGAIAERMRELERERAAG